MIGVSISEPTSWNPMREASRWIGKPWRRVEVTTYCHFYKDEQVDRSTDITLHLGLRRLGFSVTLILGHASVLDYSDEPHQ